MLFANRMISVKHNSFIHNRTLQKCIRTVYEAQIKYLMDFKK